MQQTSPRLKWFSILEDKKKKISKEISSDEGRKNKFGAKIRGKIKW